uniref:Uncharacterized protein n=1 Tax=Agaricus bisporus virus 5 TaxID=1945749 RepID=A0A1Q1N6L4_9VIRU|nr:hypothetical protein [Agaricus bisporus virus 5]
MSTQNEGRELGAHVELPVMARDNYDTIVSIPVEAGKQACKSFSSITAVASIGNTVHGPVSLKKLVVKYTPDAEKQGVDVLLTNASATITSMNFKSRPNYISKRSNPRNYGDTVEFEIPVPTGLAGQIFPDSGLFPALKIFINAVETEVNLYIYLECHGDRFTYASGF